METSTYLVVGHAASDIAIFHHYLGQFMIASLISRTDYGATFFFFTFREKVVEFEQFWWNSKPVKHLQVHIPRLPLTLLLSILFCAMSNNEYLVRIL